MVRRAECNAVTADRSIIRRSRVEDVCAVDFFGLREALDQAKVRWRKLCLIQVIVDCLAGDRVAQTNFIVLLVVDVAL